MIFLASAIRQYPDELLADFQEYYNLNIYSLIYPADNFESKELNYHQLGVLCWQLPLGSRVKRELSTQTAWDEDTQLLAQLEYDTRCLLHAFLSYGSKNYKVQEKDLEPIKPTNTKELERREKGNKKLEIDGETIVPVTKEELAEMFGH